MEHFVLSLMRYWHDFQLFHCLCVKQNHSFQVCLLQSDSGSAPVSGNTSALTEDILEESDDSGYVEEICNCCPEVFGCAAIASLITSYLYASAFLRQDATDILLILSTFWEYFSSCSISSSWFLPSYLLIFHHMNNG